MANFDLILAALADGQPVEAADLRYLAECVAKCANFAEGSMHELGGIIELIGSNAEIHLTDGAKLVANGDSSIIKATGSSAWLMANLSAIVSLEVVGENAKIEFGPNKWPTLSSRSVPRQPRANWYPEVGTWTYGNGIWTASDNGENLVLDEQIETNATLDEVYIYLDCSAHGGNWPPEYPTHVALYKRSASAGTMTLITEMDDPLVPSYQANYEAQHQIIFGELDTTFTYGERLFVRLTTEHGTYAAGSGTTVSGARLSSYFTDLRQG
jgi:hypothetical protein